MYSAMKSSSNILSVAADFVNLSALFGIPFHFLEEPSLNHTGGKSRSIEKSA